MFWNNYVALCAERGTSPNAVAKEIGISSGSVTGWKNGAVPRDTALQRIATYFGVTPYELTADNSNAAGTLEEATSERLKREVIDKVSAMSPSELEALAGLLRLPPRKREYLLKAVAE